MAFPTCAVRYLTNNSTPNSERFKYTNIEEDLFVQYEHSTKVHRERHIMQAG